jgi:hypothetical protein
MTRHHRGYAMPLVLMLLLLLSGALTTLLFSLAGAVRVGETALHRRQVFHAAEGAQVAAIELAAERLRGMPLAPSVPPSDPGFPAALAAMLAAQQDEVSTFVNDQRPSFSEPPYEMGEVKVSELKPAEQALIPGGAFAGMLAQVQRFNITVAATRTHDETPASLSLVAEVQRATISMFQFYVFSDVYLDLDPGGVVNATGRIHTNGDFCIAGEPRVDTVTAAGRILMSNPNSHGLCRRRATERNNIQIAVDDSFTSFREMTIDHTNSAWPSVETTFNRHLLDSRHNVGTLKMPLSGRPRVQAGANVLAMERATRPSDPSLMVPADAALEDNTTSMRFLVDPLLETEPDDVKRQKFAFKADIRIIDGVWFVRDENSPADIGIPIWSDHAGDVDNNDHYQGYVGVGNGSAEGIITARVTGQDEPRALHSWASPPQRYSYYGFTSESGGEVWARTASSPPAVISYGLVRRSSAGTKPAFYSTTSMPPTLSDASSLSQYLQGARSGFKNGWIEARSESDDPDGNGGASPVEVERSRLLPVNFDVAAFIGALKDCNRGELGEHFSGSCNGSGRVFNGVVYISSTWPGSMDGLSDVAATSRFAKLWPTQPADQTTRLMNSALPMPLCTKATTALRAVSGGPTVMAARPCNTYRRNATPDSPFPNIVRVINADHINPSSSVSFAGVNIPASPLPDGLTIATNLPIVVEGNANVDTVPKVNRLVTPPGAYFVPFLIAGDRFHRHSNSWSDANANWSESMATSAPRRVATSTVQHLEILAGWNPTPSRPLAGHDHSSDGFEDFPRYNERWNCGGASATATYFGSIVVAFASVYEHTGANNDSGHGTSGDFTTCFPRRSEGFDFHLEDPRNQPPGAPLILAQSIGFVGKR